MRRPVRPECPDFALANRTTRAQEVAEAIVPVSSRRASYLMGATMRVDADGAIF